MALLFRRTAQLTLQCCFNIMNVVTFEGLQNHRALRALCRAKAALSVYQDHGSSKAYQEFQLALLEANCLILEGERPQLKLVVNQ